MTHHVTEVVICHTCVTDDVCVSGPVAVGVTVVRIGKVRMERRKKM